MAELRREESVGHTAGEIKLAKILREQIVQWRHQAPHLFLALFLVILPQFRRLLLQFRGKALKDLGRSGNENLAAHVRI